MNRFEPWASLIVAAALSAIFMLIWQSQLVAPSSPAGTGFDRERAFAALSRLLKEERPPHHRLARKPSYP